jgi:hypothetical protein
MKESPATWACARAARFSPGYKIAGFQPWSCVQPKQFASCDQVISD